MKTTIHPHQVRDAAAAAFLAMLLASCSNPRPLKGGKAFARRDLTGSFQQSLSQGENPAQASRQDQHVIKIRTYTLPAGARIEDCRGGEFGSGSPFTNLQSIVINAPMPVSEREEFHTKTELGASQKDTAREIGAKLSSLRAITWAGVILFVVGLASLVWAPLKAIVGSVTTSAAIMLGGLALVVLPTLIVGNELLILGGVALSSGAWFLAHRHGQLRGQLSSFSTPLAAGAVTESKSATQD